MASSRRLSITSAPSPRRCRAWPTSRRCGHDGWATVSGPTSTSRCKPELRVDAAHEIAKTVEHQLQHHLRLIGRDGPRCPRDRCRNSHSANTARTRRSAHARSLRCASTEYGMTRAPHRIVRLLRPGASVGLPKGIFAALRRQPPPIRVAPILLEAASLSAEALYAAAADPCDRSHYRRSRGTTAVSTAPTWSPPMGARASGCSCGTP